jgi:hypothetical protein
LQRTRDDLTHNHVNLIEPLKARLADLENLIQEKEQKVKRNYKRKLKRCKKELENEKKINISLIKRISLFNPHDRSISDIDLNEDANPGLKYVSKKQSKSQMDFNRGMSRFEQMQTYADMKRYRETRTIDTEDGNKDRVIPVQLNSARSNEEGSHKFANSKMLRPTYSKFSVCKV